jgi:CheY-like chemotaxis protein
LSGKKILVAEDTLLLRKVIVSSLVALGATVEYSENGQEALQLVYDGLIDRRKHGSSNNLPYDYILMDCEVRAMISFPFIFFHGFSA